MSLGIRILPETLRALAYTSLSSTYMGIGTALNNPARILKFTNTTDVLVTLSWDGVNDHSILPSNSFLLIDVTSNKADTSGGLYVSEGTRFYAKTAGSPSEGDVYLESYYSSVY